MTAPESGFTEAIVLTGARSAGWAQAQLADMHAALLALGLKSQLLAVGPGIDHPAIIARADPRRCLVLDGNNRVKLPPGIRKFSHMVDHPCSRLDDLRVGQTADTVLGWVDASHLAAARILRVPYKSGFIAHAGPEPVAHPAAMAVRDIDVLFAGYLAEPLTPAQWQAQNPKSPDIITKLVFTVIERISGRDEPVFPAFLAAAQALGIDLNRDLPVEVICALVATCQQIAEVNRRVDLLTALPAGIRLHIAANHLPAALSARENLVYHGYIDDFAALRGLMARSRLVLNATSKFPDGAHERIWYAMAEGAVALTDYSRYLARDFRDHHAIRYLPVHAEDSALADLADLVRDHHALDAMAAAALPIYQAGHCWRERMREVLLLAA